MALPTTMQTIMNQHSRLDLSITTTFASGESGERRTVSRIQLFREVSEQINKLPNPETPGVDTSKLPLRPSASAGN